MRKIIYLAGMAALFSTSGCIVADGGHGGHAGYDHHDVMVVGPPVVVVRAPVMVVRPPEVIVR
jgi:hypothetical protein